MPLDKQSIQQSHNFQAIKTKEIREFTLQSLEQYSSADKLEKADKVADILLQMLRKRKQIRNVKELPTWVEIMVSAALIHNLFYDGTMISIFMARQKLQHIARECGVPENGSYAIFQAVECQLGDDMPIESCRPVPSTPNELFAWACWFAHQCFMEEEEKRPCGC